MKFFLSILSFICAELTLNAQSFVKTYYDSPVPRLYFNHIKATPDSGMIGFGGYEFGYVNRLVKFDKDMNITWAKSVDGDSLTLLPGDVQLTVNGGYITTSTIIYSVVHRGIYLHEFDANGNLLNEKKYSFYVEGGGIGANENIHSCITSGGHVATIFSSLDSLSIFHATVCVLDSNLNLLWTKYIGRSINENEFGKFVVETSDGNLLFAVDYKDINNSNSSAQLIKTDLNGNILWSRIINLGLITTIKHLSTSVNGDVIVAGDVYFTGDIYTGRIDNNGTFRLLKIYNTGTPSQYPYISESKSGKINIVYTNQDINFNSRGCFLQTDSTGFPLSSLILPPWYFYMNVDQLADGNLVLSGGRLDTTVYEFDEWRMTKTDSNAVNGCAQVSLLSINSSVPNFNVDSLYYDSVITTTLNPLQFAVNPVQISMQTECIINGFPDGPEENILSVFPSPASEKINILIELLHDETLRIFLSDVLGREFALNKYSKTEEGILVDISDVPNGIYQLQVIVADKSYTSKTVISR